MSSTKTTIERYSTSGIPVPTTAIATKRYDNTNLVTSTHNSFAPSLFEPHDEPNPSYLPQNWSSYTHPEGQLYFVRDLPLRIVTEANMFKPETADKIMVWVKWFDDEVSQQGTKIPESVELCLRVEDESCEYYFVDHSLRTEFWLTQLPAENLGLPAAVSSSHTRLVLEEHYWNHVQYFPMHFGGISTKSMDELIGIFVQGQADQLTSSVSTFPYSAEKCSQFLTLLRGSRDDASNGHITCVAARLFGFVTASRFQSLYGQENARLSRDQPVLHAPISEGRWLSGVASLALLGAPNSFLPRFKDLYVDKLVYIDQWESFIAQCNESWRLSLMMAFPLLISSLLISVSPSSVPALSLASFVVCCSCIFSAVALISRHSSLKIVDSDAAADYLSQLHSEVSGFRFAAAVFSLPQAFVNYGIALFLAQGLIVAYHTVGVIGTAVASAFVFVLALAVGAVISPVGLSFSLAPKPKATADDKV